MPIPADHQAAVITLCDEVLEAVEPVLELIMKKEKGSLDMLYTLIAVMAVGRAVDTTVLPMYLQHALKDEPETARRGVQMCRWATEAVAAIIELRMTKDRPSPNDILQACAELKLRLDSVTTPSVTA